MFDVKQRRKWEERLDYIDKPDGSCTLANLMA